nr:uncharacterized protein LOC109162903 [Ipomoea batatas]
MAKSIGFVPVTSGSAFCLDELNTDAAIDINSRVYAFGCVLRDSEGLFVAAMPSSCTGVLQAKVTEAISIRDQSGGRRRLAMDGEEQHHLREVPPNATSRHRIRDPHRVAGQIHQDVFPCHVGALESSAIRDRSTTPDHPSEESSAIPSGALVFVVVGDWRRELFVGFFTLHRTMCALLGQ